MNPLSYLSPLGQISNTPEETQKFFAEFIESSLGLVGVLTILTQSLVLCLVLTSLGPMGSGPIVS